MRKQRGIILAILGLLAVSLATSCGEGGAGVPTPSTQEAERVSSSPPPSAISSEQWDDYYGISRDPDGHLRVEGNTDVRLPRLVSRLNQDAKTQSEGMCAPYKISGAYNISDGLAGYQDMVRYVVQISFDSPEAPTNPGALQQGGNGKDDPYALTDAILAHLNTEGAEVGCTYKFRARYTQEETLPRYDLKNPVEGGTISERIDAMVHLSFDSLIRPGSNNPTPARNLEREAIAPEASIPYVNEWKKIVARAALEFAQVFRHADAELTITTIDFVGDAPDGPEWTYVFDSTAIKELREMRAAQGHEIPDPLPVLALGEEKLRKLRWAQPPPEPLPRNREPIDERAIGIVARLAQETAKVNLNPSSGIFIAVYDFVGETPSISTTWIYFFGGEAIRTLREETLAPEEILAQAAVIEQWGEIPGPRVVPPVKQAPSRVTGAPGG